MALQSHNNVIYFRIIRQLTGYLSSREQSETQRKLLKESPGSCFRARRCNGWFAWKNGFFYMTSMPWQYRVCVQSHNGVMSKCYKTFCYERITAEGIVWCDTRQSSEADCFPMLKFCINVKNKNWLLKTQFLYRHNFSINKSICKKFHQRDTLFLFLSHSLASAMRGYDTFSISTVVNH